MELKEFYKIVEEEVKLLRENINEEEVSNIGIMFESGYTQSCVYGQITGHCSSNRSKYLMNKCVSYWVSNSSYLDDVRVGHMHSDYDVCFFEYRLSINSSLQDSSPYEFVEDVEDSRNYYSYTPLEAYIMLYGSKDNEIIDYLKGDTNELNLEI